MHLSHISIQDVRTLLCFSSLLPVLPCWEPAWHRGQIPQSSARQLLHSTRRRARKNLWHNESSNHFQSFPYVLLTCKVFTKITLIKRRKIMSAQKRSLFWVRFNAHVTIIDLLHQSWSTFQTSHQFAELRRARGPHLDKASHLKPDGVQESKCGRKTLSIENIFVQFVKLLMFEELIC